MPYLNWDTHRNFSKSNALITKKLNHSQQSRPSGSNVRVSSHGTPQAQDPIHGLIGSQAELPLHTSRSLDQYGHPTLENTMTRDEDQVIYKAMGLDKPRFDDDDDGRGDHQEFLDKMRDNLTRPFQNAYQEQRNESEFNGRTKAKILIVDQLWLWVTDQGTLLTCYPSKDDDMKSGHTDILLGSSGLNKAMLSKFLVDPSSSPKCHTPYELAALMVLTSVNWLLDKLQEDDLDVLQLFEKYISHWTEELNQSFKKFQTFQSFQAHQSGDMRENPEYEENADSSRDLHGLLELHDIVDELTTLTKLMDDQTAVVRRLERRYKQIQELQSASVVDGPEFVSPQSLVWLEQALARLRTYQKQIKDMASSCSKAQDQYKSLLDLKQRQANLNQAKQAAKSAEETARQGRAIMVFTIVTIVFLPLSFFTSLFGMNASDWSGTASNPSLRSIGILMGSISATVILGALLIAYMGSVLKAIFGVAWVLLFYLVVQVGRLVIHGPRKVLKKLALIPVISTCWNLVRPARKVSFDLELGELHNLDDPDDSDGSDDSDSSVNSGASEDIYTSDSSDSSESYESAESSDRSRRAQRR